MGKLAAEIAAPAKSRLVVLGSLVYRIVRVNSDELRRVGYAGLEGAASVRAVETQLRQHQRELRAKLSGLKGEALEELLKAEAAKEEALLDLRYQRLLERPEGQTAMLERSTAYVCAAVRGAGKLLDTTIRPLDGNVVHCDLDEVASVLADLRDEAQIAAGVAPIYLEDLRFVTSEADHNPEKGRVWVHALPEAARRVLGQAIADLQSITADLEPFRLRAGEPAGPGRAGAEVQQAPARDPEAAAGGSGAGDHVPGRRARKGAGKGQRQQGMAGR